MQMPMTSPDWKSHVTPHFYCLDLWNAVGPLMTPSALCYANGTANGVTWQKGHIAPHFNHFAWRNTVVPSMMPLVSYDANMMLMSMPIVSHDPKSHITPYFYHLDLRNVTALLTVLSQLCDADECANDITWPKRSCYIPFWMSFPKECNGGIDDANSMTWCWN